MRQTARTNPGAIRLAMGEKMVLGLEVFLAGHRPDHRRADLELAGDPRQYRSDPHGDRLFPEPGVEPGT